MSLPRWDQVHPPGVLFGPIWYAVDYGRQWEQCEVQRAQTLAAGPVGEPERTPEGAKRGNPASALKLPQGNSEAAVRVAIGK